MVKGPILCFSALAILASSVPAHAAPPDPAPDPTKGTRDALVIAGTAVDVAGTGWAVYGFVAGEKPLMGSGLTMVATVPIIAYGATVVEEHPSDGVAWALTLWAGVLFTKACVDIVSSNHATPKSDKPPANGPHISFAPSAVQGVDKQPHAALAIAGTF